jgi:hypothetical protein
MKTIEVSTHQKFDYATLQVELNQFEQKRKRVKLLKKIEKAKAIKIAEFFENKFVSLMNQIMIDKFQKRKFFKIMNSKKYKYATQHDLNIFIRECRKFFEIRRHIYFDDKNKILFIRNFLKNVSMKNWKKHQKIIDTIFIFWEQFIDFLQKHLNLKHLRLFETNARLKKTRQLNKQSITNLIVYFNTLKIQLSKELIDYQKYFNLMKALHSYLKTTIIRRINAIVFRNELKEITRLIEKIEFVSKHIKKKRSLISKRIVFNFMNAIVSTLLTHYKKQFKTIIETKVVIEKNFENEIEIEIEKILIFINYSKNHRIAVKSNVEIAK